MLLAGCTVPTTPLPDRPEPRALPSLTVYEILAPVQGDGRSELAELGRLPDQPTVRLRRARIWIETGGYQRAVRELNRVIFGEPRPTRAVESFARDLRSLAHEKAGDPDRPAHHLAQAEQLAHDPELSRLIRDAADRARPAEPVPAPVAAEHLARSEWHAAPPRSRRMVPMTLVDKITVHHSAMLAYSDSKSRSSAVLRAIQKNHMAGNGWADIGYHFVIDRTGRIWDGRGVDWQGAHAGDPRSNRGNIGICLLGNFTDSGQQPSPAQLAALHQLVTDLRARYRIAASSVLTHRELRPTACPGENLQAAVERMRQEMLGDAAQPAPPAVRRADE